MNFNLWSLAHNSILKKWIHYNFTCKDNWLISDTLILVFEAHAVNSFIN